ncbi:MAG TPA: DUF4013 domain-containing protein [Candidatus Dormibacteraeota bacterium]
MTGGRGVLPHHNSSPLESFTYPFRRRAPWLAGSLLVLAWPLSFPILLGYALAATRAAAADPRAAPPPLAVTRRTLAEGTLLGLAIAIVSVPFVAMLLAIAVSAERLALPEPYLLVGGACLASLGWAMLALLLLPPNAAVFARTGRARDLLDPVAAGRRVRSRFVVWNVATVVMVTAWLIALASACLCCIGFLPGAFYAMLVSAHAAGSLADPET